MFKKCSDSVQWIMRDSYDPGDAWGWAMGHHFAICELMYAEMLDIPAEWEFHPSPFVSRALDAHMDEYPDCEWVEEWLAGHIDAKELLYVGNVLHRYEKLLEKAGRSY